MASYYNDNEIKGFDYWVFLSEDANEAPPTTQYCQGYANQNGIDPSRMLIDPGFETLFSNVDSGQQGGIGLPWDGVVDGVGMYYKWNPSVTEPPDWQTAVGTLLGE